MLLDEFHVCVNSINKTGTTPLHRACSVGNPEMIRLLCGRGADLFAKDLSGRLPADYGNASVRQQIQVLL
jgi:ankyrin repeat protein